MIVLNKIFSAGYSDTHSSTHTIDPGGKVNNLWSHESRIVYLFSIFSFHSAIFKTRNSPYANALFIIYDKIDLIRNVTIF